MHGAKGELVKILGAQKHIVALAQHGVDDGHLGQAIDRLTNGIVDGVLALGHRGSVLLERDHLLLLGGVEQQQILELLLLHAVGRVDAELQTAAEVLEEAFVLLAIVVAQFDELLLDLLLNAAGDGLELVVVLQGLAADVQGKVLGVNHAAHEVEVVGQQLLALLLDKDVGAVERQALLVILAVQVEGCTRRDEQQRVVAQRALGVHADGCQRVLPIVEVGLVELVVILVGDVGLATLPNGDHRVDGLKLLDRLVLGFVVVAGVLGLGLGNRLGAHHLDGIAHVVAVALDELLQRGLGQVLAVVDLLGGILKVQDDVGAVGFLLGGLDGVALDAVGDPTVSLVGAVSLGDDLDLLGNHEGGVEAHAELADDVDVAALGIGVLLLEVERAGVGDGAQVLVHLVGAHADAGVADGDGALIEIEGDANGQVALLNLDGFVGEALEVELVHRVRCVGDQFAKENLAIGVDGVDHQV